MNQAIATLSLKEMGKFLWEGREKSFPSSLVFHFGVGRNASFPQKPVVKLIHTLDSFLKVKFSLILILQDEHYKHFIFHILTLIFLNPILITSSVCFITFK